MLTFKEISARLSAIDDLIKKIEHEHLLTDTSDFLEMKQRLRKLNNRILETISEEELIIFEQGSCCQIILNHLDSSAALYNIPWRRPQTDSIPKTNCIAWLNHQCETFIQPLITEIKEKKRATKGKQPVRIIDSDAPDNFARATNPLLSLQLQKLKPIFVTIKSIHYNLLPRGYSFKKASSTDLVNIKLVRWQTQYQKNAELSRSLIDEVNDKLRYLPFTDEGYQEQGLLLSNSIESLKKLNTHQVKLAQQILAEEELAFPDSKKSEQQWADLKQQAYLSLKKTLHFFVHYVIEIDAKNINPEFQDFIEALKQCIKDLIHDLAQGEPPLAPSDAIDTLKNLLFHSIDKQVALSSSIIQGNEFDVIDAVLSQLFPGTLQMKKEDDVNSSLNKEQIERIYSIRAKLQENSIEKSAQYFNLHKVIAQTKATIAEKSSSNKLLVSQLQDKITSLAKELEQKYKFFPFSSTLYKTAHERVNQLFELKTKLSNLLVDIENETSSLTNKANLHSQLKQFEDSTSNADFSQALKEMAQLKESADNKLKSQEQLQDHLEKVAVTIQNADDVLTELTFFYEHARLELHKTLDSKIIETKLMLESLGWNNDVICQMLKSHIDLTLKIDSKDIDLTRTQDNVTTFVINLNKVISEVQEKKELRKQLEAKINETTRALKSLRLDDGQIAQALKPHIELCHEIFLRNSLLTRSQEKVEQALIILDKIISESQDKMDLHAALQIKIKEATFILDLIGVQKDKISETLKQPLDLSTKIYSKNYSLAQIQAKVAEAITTLDTRMLEITGSLRKNIASQQEAIKTRCFDLTKAVNQLAHYKTLDIPFFGVLKKEINNINRQHLNYQLHIDNFSPSMKAEFKPWYESYCENYRALQIDAKACDELIVGAKNIEKEIERRSQTQAYKTVSQTILSDLKIEFNRIFDLKITHSRQLSTEQKDALCRLKPKLLSQTVYAAEIPVHTSKVPVHTAEMNEALKRIDPRLSKLALIFYQFEKINHEYMRSNYQEASEPADYKKVDQNYIDALRKQANMSLRGPNMEHMSDGVRSGFIQWLRKHIVKPLQDLGRKNDFVFFPTKWACKTEKKLVKLGNDAHQSLTSMSAG